MMRTVTATRKFSTWKPFYIRDVDNKPRSETVAPKPEPCTSTSSETSAERAQSTSVASKYILNPNLPIPKMGAKPSSPLHRTCATEPHPNIKLSAKQVEYEKSEQGKLDPRPWRSAMIDDAAFGPIKKHPALMILGFIIGKHSAAVEWAKNAAAEEDVSAQAVLDGAYTLALKIHDHDHKCPAAHRVVTPDLYYEFQNPLHYKSGDGAATPYIDARVQEKLYIRLFHGHDMQLRADAIAWKNSIPSRLLRAGNGQCRYSPATLPAAHMNSFRGEVLESNDYEVLTIRDDLPVLRAHTDNRVSRDRPAVGYAGYVGQLGSHRAHPLLLFHALAHYFPEEFPTLEGAHERGRNGVEFSVPTAHLQELFFAPRDTAGAASPLTRFRCTETSAKKPHRTGMHDQVIESVNANTEGLVVANEPLGYYHCVLAAYLPPGLGPRLPLTPGQAQ